MVRRIAFVVVAAALVLPACKSRTPAEDKLRKTVRQEEAIVSKIDAIKTRQALLTEKLAAYEARLEQVRSKRKELENQVGRHAPKVIRPGEPTS